MSEKKAEKVPAVDDRAVIITEQGCWWPSTGPAATGGKAFTLTPVDSVDKLVRLLDYLLERGKLQSVGTTAQVWVLGAAAVEALGWLVDPGERRRGDTLQVLRERVRAQLTAVIEASQADLNACGWTLREGWKAGGYRIRLQKTPPQHPRGRNTKAPQKTLRVDVVLEPYAWTTGGAATSDDEREMLGVLGGEANGTGLPDTETDIDAARVELGQRLAWCVDNLGMLPAVTGSATGAAISERLWREGEERNQHLAVKRAAGTATRERDAWLPTGPGPLPLLTDPAPGTDELEPHIIWWRLPSPEEIRKADKLVVTDQRASYLAGAAIHLALGEPEPLSREQVESSLWLSDPELPIAKWPRGLWLIQPPAAEDVPGWDMLPPAHQTWWAACAAGEYPPLIWVTTETLAGMAADESAGGFGLQWCQENVALVNGWIWPGAGQALRRFQDRLSKAYKLALATDNRAMKAVVGDIYKGYFGRLLNSAEQWGRWRARHSQPVWSNQIHATATVRNRRKAAEIAQRTAEAIGEALFPVGANTDDLTYLVPEGVDTALLADDDSDGKFALGRMVVKREIVLTDEARERMLSADNRKRFAIAVAELLKQDKASK